jgi:hypothetical protein
MFKFFLKYFKKFSDNLLLYFINHKFNRIGVINKTIQYISYPIINLEKNWTIKNEKTLLSTYEGDSTFSSSSEYPVVVSWTKSNNRTLATSDLFIKSQYKEIKKTHKKKTTKSEELINLLPKYTSHFGHFVGDILGPALYYSKYSYELNLSNKLLLITPSKKWDSFLKNLLNDKIHILKPIDALKTNYIFTNSRILPEMSSVQSYMLSRNILSHEIMIDNSSPKKIFLTTEREDRIANIDQLKNELLGLNFEIINPSKFEIKDLLTIIKSAKVLISEKASILNNVYLVRDTKYFILSSETEKELDMKLFHGAGIYKEFHRGLAKEIYCEDSPKIQNLRAYKKRIVVNIKNVISIINNEKY